MHGRYTTTVRFDTAGATWVADIEFTIEGDLLSRAEFLNVKPLGG
jgi:hypothetical protein